MSVPDDIGDTVEEAELLRAALDVLADDLAILHGYQPETWEGRLLATVVIMGADYNEILQTIMESKKRER